MAKKYILTIFLLLNILSVKSQEGKLGINTSTPTEILDANGTVRLREHPLNRSKNSINTKSDGSASESKDQTFNAAQVVVSDNNGVLGSMDVGVPVTSVTQTFIAPAGGFLATGTQTNPTYKVAIGTLEVGFYQTSNNNQLYVVFRSNQPGSDTYTADLREFGGTYQDWRTSQSLPSGTWSNAVGWLGIGVDTWLLNINYQSLNVVYRVTILGARWSGGSSNTTRQGDQFTVNIQQLYGTKFDL